VTVHPVRPEAEARSHEGSAVGVLVLHGFTGSPQTMRLVADAMVSAGFSVEVPRLPGHGTHIDDMKTTGFDDWAAAVEATYGDLFVRTDKVVVVGLSMGGTLAAWLTARHPEIAGAVFVNPLAAPFDPAMLHIVDEMIAAGETESAGTRTGSDIADPDAIENAYAGNPLVPLRSLSIALRELQSELAKITCPILIMTSTNDHVVDPASSDHLAATVSGPVERVTLERSFHVATLDYDRDIIIDRTIAFVHKVVGDPGSRHL
jgi:carboxylesterase